MKTDGSPRTPLNFRPGPLLSSNTAKITSPSQRLRIMIQTWPWKPIMAAIFLIFLISMVLHFFSMRSKPTIKEEVNRILASLEEDDDVDSVNSLPLDVKLKHIEAAHNTPNAQLEAFLAYSGGFRELMDQRLWSEDEFRAAHTSSNAKEAKALIEEANEIEKLLIDLDKAFGNAPPLAEQTTLYIGSADVCVYQMYVLLTIAQINATIRFGKKKVQDEIVWDGFSIATPSHRMALDRLGNHRCCLFTLIVPPGLKTLDIESYRMYLESLRSLRDREAAYEEAAAEMEEAEPDPAQDMLLPRHLTMVVKYIGWRRHMSARTKHYIMEVKLPTDQPPPITLQQQQHTHERKQTGKRRRSTRSHSSNKGGSVISSLLFWLVLVGAIAGAVVYVRRQFSQLQHEQVI